MISKLPASSAWLHTPMESLIWHGLKRCTRPDMDEFFLHVMGERFSPYGNFLPYGQRIIPMSRDETYLLLLRHRASLQAAAVDQANGRAIMATMAGPRQLWLAAATKNNAVGRQARRKSRHSLARLNFPL